PNPVRVEGRSLGSRMRLPDERSFAPDHVEKLGCVGGMVDGSVLRVLLDKLSARQTPVRPVHGFGDQQVVVAAKVHVGLLPGEYEEAAVRMAPAHFVVVVQVLEPQAAVVLRMAV